MATDVSHVRRLASLTKARMPATGASGKTTKCPGRRPAAAAASALPASTAPRGSDTYDGASVKPARAAGGTRRDRDVLRDRSPLPGGADGSRGGGARFSMLLAVGAYARAAGCGRESPVGPLLPPPPRVDREALLAGRERGRGGGAAAM